MTTIGFIRHGSTQWNKEGRAQGESDIPLDADGIAQGEALAERLVQQRWDIIYSSDLQRAHRTADLVRERIGLETVYSDMLLREMSGGLVEGMTMAERVSKWGPDWQSADLKMESAESGAKRGIAFVEQAVSRHPGGRILVVSHGALLKHTLKALVPNFPMEERLQNTSITIVRNQGAGWECELYNCSAHLK